MSTTIDLYEYKEVLCRHDDYDYEKAEWFETTNKATGLIEVRKAPKKLKKRLTQLGYNDDDFVFVVIQ